MTLRALEKSVAISELIRALKIVVELHFFPRFIAVTIQALAAQLALVVVRVTSCAIRRFQIREAIFQWNKKLTCWEGFRGNVGRHELHLSFGWNVTLLTLGGLVCAGQRVGCLVVIKGKPLFKVLGRVTLGTSCRVQAIGELTAVDIFVAINTELIGERFEFIDLVFAWSVAFGTRCLDVGASQCEPRLAMIKFFARRCVVPTRSHVTLRTCFFEHGLAKFADVRAFVTSFASLRFELWPQVN